MHHYDILKQSFYLKTFENAATTLDKIRVRPDQNDDPFNALKDFYFGKIKFNWADNAKFMENANGILLGDTRTSLALRYIRIVRDMKSAVEPTPESVDLIRKIQNSDSPFIPVDQSDDLGEWGETYNSFAMFRIKKCRIHY